MLSFSGNLHSFCFWQGDGVISGRLDTKIHQIAVYIQIQIVLKG